ncbi:hypothetical protein PT974_03570 [Cladobotryum mycophilum]|uniref:Nucleoside phosphorylase domain-containing protein n=1 Tax=Cladobotryum mycophilum TaxID=491253 RepID=A0ABR0SSP2_9HYPO
MDRDGDQYGRAQGDPNTYTTGCMGGYNVVVVLLSNVGKVSAASAAASLRSSYSCIKFLLLTGICGGVPMVNGQEMPLGDVVISKTIIQYDLGRKDPDKLRPKETISDSLGRRAKNIRQRLETRSASLLDQIQNREIEKKYNRSQRSREDQTYAYPGSSNDMLFEADYRHQHRLSSQCECANCHEDSVCEDSRKLSCDQLGYEEARLVLRESLEEKKQLERDGLIKDAQSPWIFIGQFGSGDKVPKSRIDRDRLAQEHDILAFEMEGAGILDELPCIIVKAVCNYAVTRTMTGNTLLPL